MSSYTSGCKGIRPPVTGFFGGFVCGAVRASRIRYSSCQALSARWVFRASSYSTSVVRAPGGNFVNTVTNACGSTKGANLVLTIKSAASSQSASSGVGNRSRNAGGRSESENSSFSTISILSLPSSIGVASSTSTVGGLGSFCDLCSSAGRDSPRFGGLESSC
jgi:hypothetical protein